MPTVIFIGGSKDGRKEYVENLHTVEVCYRSPNINIGPLDFNKIPDAIDVTIYREEYTLRHWMYRGSEEPKVFKYYALRILTDEQAIIKLFEGYAPYQAELL